ncbi:Nuclear pore complex protein NUP88 [Gracilariopsis chorda]|uniref:Nuclear pore complex protein NUP88 n=1 Tax=Gracilariopsis chorda TaxID=448386 RepID=A0A2V3J6S6_9FLOR|nr:Nuclear pore complex protein NUP88 [Gracilariopsis chorda]|eukprot:PXF50074.1 Nuclear pore complex protein NUP88 [Gracilariopsis chorda]
MQALRTHLRALRAVCESEEAVNNTPRILPALSPAHITVPDPDARQLHQLPLSKLSTARSIRATRPFRHAIVSGPYLALYSDRSVAVHHVPSGRSYPVAEALFRDRPALSVLHAQWLPSAPAFLVLLTSDCCLRVFDVVSPEAAETARQRVHVVTAGSAPVSFVCGAGSGWHALCVYVLAEDGALYVAAPLAPIGTTINLAEFRQLRDAAMFVLEQHAADSPQQKDMKRRLSFGDSDLPWSVRQARLQLRFLDTVFEQNAQQMIAVREFKPAPLLFQGPLHVENEVPTEKCTQLLLLSTSSHPVLLRVSEHGRVSVLLAMERFDAQWFLSSQPMEQGLLLASEQYADCARSVAPALLCFEQFVFDAPVALVPVASLSYADTYFLATRSAVYSLTLSFLSLLDDELALERSPRSTLRQLFTVKTPGDSSALRISGFTSHYVRGDGPVAILHLSDGTFHTTDPLRWHTVYHDVPNLLPLNLLVESHSSSRAYACKSLAESVVHALRHVENLRGQNGRVADGTLGTVSSLQSLASTLAFLEKRVIVLTGGDDQPGIGDSLGNVATLLLQWTDELSQRAKNDISKVSELQQAISEGDRSEEELQAKLKRAQEGADQLKSRVRTVFEAIERGSLQLSKAEVERLATLRQKKRRIAAFRTRTVELAAAIRKRNERLANMLREVRQKEDWFSSTSGVQSWRDSSPFARRRERPAEQRALEFGSKELQQIKVALEKHSEQISDAMELSSSLWKRLSITT